MLQNCGNGRDNTEPLTSRAQLLSFSFDCNIIHKSDIWHVHGLYPVWLTQRGTEGYECS
jgi:hypothetical protein